MLFRSVFNAGRENFSSPINTFAPLQPISWKRKPTEWLSSVDIQKVMKQWENAYKCFEFIGPTPIDFDSHKLYGECVWEELCKFNLSSFLKKNKTKIKQTRADFKKEK